MCLHVCISSCLYVCVHVCACVRACMCVCGCQLVGRALQLAHGGARGRVSEPQPVSAFISHHRVCSVPHNGDNLCSEPVLKYSSSEHPLPQFLRACFPSIPCCLAAHQLDGEHLSALHPHPQGVCLPHGERSSGLCCAVMLFTPVPLSPLLHPLLLLVRPSGVAHPSTNHPSNHGLKCSPCVLLVLNCHAGCTFLTYPSFVPLSCPSSLSPAPPLTPSPSPPLPSTSTSQVELGIADRETWNMLLQLVKERGFSERRQVRRWAAGGAEDGGREDRAA